MNLSRCLLSRKAPRRQQQRRGHTSVGGGAPTTSQGQCYTCVVLISITNASAPSVSVGRLPPGVNLSCPLLKMSPDFQRPEGYGGGRSCSHSQHPPRGGGPATVSRRPDTCVVLMRNTNAGALGVVGAATAHG